MDSFNDDDRRYAADAAAQIEAMRERLVVIERRLRHLPARTAVAIVAAVSKRALILIGLGIALGSLLGGAGIEFSRHLIAIALGAR